MNKFDTVLKKYGLLSEDRQVSSDEESKLPDRDFVDTQEVPDSDFSSQDSIDSGDQEDVETSFTQREINMLDTAVKLHFNNPDIDLETRNELEKLQREKDYQALWERLISIADGYEL